MQQGGHAQRATRRRPRLGASGQTSRKAVVQRRRRPGWPGASPPGRAGTACARREGNTHQAVCNWWICRSRCTQGWSMTSRSATSPSRQPGGAGERDVAVDRVVAQSFKLKVSHPADYARRPPASSMGRGVSRSAVTPLRRARSTVARCAAGPTRAGRGRPVRPTRPDRDRRGRSGPKHCAAFRCQ